MSGALPSTHRNSLIRGKHRNAKLQSFTNKHGIDTLSFEVVELVGTNLLIEREQYWMDLMGACETGFNILPVAGSYVGHKHSDGTKRRIGEKSSGRRYTVEQRLNMSVAQTGKKLSVEHIEKLRLNSIGNKSNTGRKLTLAHRLKVSEGGRRRTSIVVISDAQKLMISVAQSIALSATGDQSLEFPSYKAAVAAGYTKSCIRNAVIKGIKYRGMLWQVTSADPHGESPPARSPCPQQ